MRRNVVKPISQDQQKYQIIMIMVDSAIDNLKRTMDVIVCLPLYMYVCWHH